MAKSGKAYTEAQRVAVKDLLEQGRDEESIALQTGVSDRTIRRWNLELTRTGRIGKPPESRTGRHRVLSPDIEAALCEHVKDKPDLSVDDILWWLYDNYKIVVGTRTIRRVFERKGEPVKTGKSRRGPPRKPGGEGVEQVEEDRDTANVRTQTPPPPPARDQAYRSPYPPMAPQAANMDVENQLRQAMQPQGVPQQLPLQPQPQHQSYSMPMDVEEELPDDEETIQLQLQQIALQKRELELKLKMRRIAGGKATPQGRNTAPTGPSTLYDPQRAATAPTPPKRDSRSKKKIEESKKRTAERQERMLRDLERRSRRRDHLTAEWVQSKDIWPLRAQGLLADLMHSYACYSYNQNNEATFEAMYQELYQLVDLSKNDWQQAIHDEMLRERMKRKMGQLRTKMQKTGEIVGRADNFGGFQKADDYTGEAAGATVGDESEMVQDPGQQQAADVLQAQPGAQDLQQQQQQQHHHTPDHMAHHQEHHLQYEHVPPEAQMHHHQHMQYPPHPAMMAHQVPGQYPMMDGDQGVLPYAPMHAGLGHDDMMV